MPADAVITPETPLEDLVERPPRALRRPGREPAEPEAVDPASKA